MEGKLTAYQKVDTLGKSQLDLVIQVYDGAISAFQAAAESYQRADDSAGRRHLEKANRFMTHLYTTLDAEKGGQVAEQLGKLYAFVISQTNILQATKDLRQIDDNITILKNLRDGWVELKKKQAVGAKSTREKPVTDSSSFATSA